MMPNFANKESVRLLIWKVWLVFSLLLVAGIGQIQMVHSTAVATSSDVVVMPASTTTTTAKISSVAATSKTPTLTMTTSPLSVLSTFIDGGNDSRDSRFATLHKEVDRLIKQWAPVVWLAPEEKFMPLGVDEFLNHVHPADKSKSIIGGMPIGDNSKKAYLVTNAKIEELLENDNSFLFGRNPSERPVPIYAVVSICNAPGQTATTTSAPTIQSYEEQPFLDFEGHQHQRQPQFPLAQQNLQSTRGPYIPVSLNPFDIRNNTVRRSSRLYPVFKRLMKREVSTFNIMPADMASAIAAQASLSYHGMEFGLKSVEAATASPPAPEETTSAPDIGPQTPSDGGSSNVNNFIANLADNVRFTGVSDEIDNSINSDHDSSNLKQKLKDKQKIPSFHVTYWMFYPYSQGKTMCTLSLGPLGRIPFPAVYGFCLGKRKDIGSHIGDWEHMSLYFNRAAQPEAMYVSAHDAGAYYTYNRLTGSFEFKKQETRKGILQRPNFPKTVTTFNNHPVLFAAKGSHGLWTAPGKHRFVKVARLYDINGFGTPWNTWKSVDITYENVKSFGRSFIPSWLEFMGKWGNPKSKCHPLRRIGLNFCEYADGPTGIPLKEPHFQCNASY